LKISTGIKIKKEDDCICIYDMVCFKCIGKSSLLGRRVCRTLKFVEDMEITNWIIVFEIVHKICFCCIPADFMLSVMLKLGTYIIQIMEQCQGMA